MGELINGKCIRCREVPTKKTWQQSRKAIGEDGMMYTPDPDDIVEHEYYECGCGARYLASEVENANA